LSEEKRADLGRYAATPFHRASSKKGESSNTEGKRSTFEGERCTSEHERGKNEAASFKSAVRPAKTSNVRDNMNGEAGAARGKARKTEGESGAS